MTQSLPEESHRPFDRRLLCRRRDRRAAAFAGFDFLFREVAERLADRLDDIRRRFPLALEIGCRGPRLSEALGTRGGVETLVACDLSERFAVQAQGGQRLPLVADAEALPFAPASFDLVLSCLDFHWVNDLPGCLAQIKTLLKPDGLLLAAFYGGGTLAELRACLLEAETATRGGSGARIAPFAELRDAAGLLQRAGFALPVADLDHIEVSYPDAFRLLDDLRGMAESNVLRARPRKGLDRATLLRCAELYREAHGRPDGKIPASFEVIFLTGWAPSAEQPKALAPGSATARLADALGERERPRGEKAPPRS